ncbi:hypothetical protein [Myxacorys almedinensis]|uniref:Uncharacterized protein n=1 Tax=Myxacorys almedinensis A TaxID=2690445 RepID=A0A8J7YY75_9CYAN|nr:hypothetical protein [Myxacorys almedinensis]NDJ16284.1 hypothetical protein [Myxacorys almedinensis A]
MTRRVLSQLNQVERIDKLELSDEVEIEEQSLLERLTDVYNESIACLEPKLILIEEPPLIEKKPLVDQKPLPNITNVEVDGNYLLFFNDIYKNRFSAWLKQILKLLTWSTLKRQVYFNSAIRELVYKLMQQNYEFRLQQLKVQSKVSDLEQQVQQLSEQVERLSSVNHQAINLLESIHQGKLESRHDFKKMVDDRETQSLK